MQSVKFLTFALVAGLLAFSQVSSSPLTGNDQNQPGPGHQLHDQQQQPATQNLVQIQGVNQQGMVKDTQKEQPKTGSRNLGFGYEQPAIYGQSYEVPVVQSYSAPVTTSYQAPVQSYSAPVTPSYSTSSYSAPVQSYSTPSYSAPVQSYSTQSYSAPVQSYSAPSYLPPVTTSYSTPSYVAPVTYEQPIVQTYQQPSYSNYSAPVYSAPVQSYSNYSTPSYQTPTYQTSTYQAPTYQATTTYQTSSYQVPTYTQSYSTPSYSNYSTPVYSQPQTYVQPTYQAPVYSQPQTYVQPTYSNYSTPSYSTPSYSTQSYSTPSYQAPVQSYSAPTYSAPTYSTPSYQAPVYETPVYNNYSTPSYQAPVYEAPVSYQQPAYQAPVQSYVQPTYQQQSYVQPTYQQQSYVQPTYQQQSYVQPTYQQQSYVQPTYQQPAYTPQGSVYKREVNDSSISYDGASAATAAAGSMTSPSSTLVSLADEMSASDSVVSASYALPPQAPTYAPHPQPAYQQTLLLLDTQPEFTQAWADFPYPPGYLPLAYRNSILGYAQQQKYRGAAGQLSANNYQGPQNIGFGYIHWNGPINPASFYLPVTLPYYYRVPPLTPFFGPNRALVYQKPVVQQIIKGTATTS